MEEISKNQSDSIENLDTIVDNHPKEVATYPYICGICSEKFDNLRKYLCHFECHKSQSCNNFHVCSCLYEDLPIANLPIDQDNSNLPIDKDNSNLPIEQDKSNLPIDQDKSNLLIDQDNSNLPIDQDNSNLPIDQDKSNLLIDQDNSNLPIDKDNSNLPIDKDNSNLPIDQDKSNLPIDKDNSNLQIDQDNSNLPINRDNSNLPIDQDKSNLPIDKDNSNLQIDKDNSNLPIDQDNSNLPIDKDNPNLPTDQDNPNLQIDQDNPNFPINQDNSNLLNDRKKGAFECSICKTVFSSICSIHSHVLKCSADGSYIFDNTKKMVYPLSVHCSDFESRENDMGENTEDHVKLTENKVIGDKSDGSVSDVMTRAEKVDHILRTVCKIYEISEREKNVSANNIDGKKVQKKRVRRKKPGTNGISEATNGETAKKKRKKNPIKGGKEIKIETAEFNDENQEIKDHIVVKVEVEETSLEELTKELLDQDFEGKGKKKPRRSSKKKNLQPKNMQKAEEECPHCGKLLKPYKMKVHLISHMEERPFQCDMCPKSYKYQGHLDTHKASHQDVKPYYCETCGKGFVTMTMLKHHSMMHHEDSKPYMCNTCGASFITNYKLKRHMTKHTGEKTVQCDLCGMGFSTRHNLSMHVQRVHKKENRFNCTQCSKQFMTNYQLKVHSMKHSGERPYKCGVCRREYTERKELRRHLKKIHDQELEESAYSKLESLDRYDAKKAFSGEDDNQIFEQTEAKRASKYIPAGEKPYKCGVCKTEYTERKGLRRHLKKKHSQQFEDSTNAPSESLERYDATKATSSKNDHQSSSFSGEGFNQIFEQTEAKSASDFISDGGNAFNYTTGNVCNSPPYFPIIKNSCMKIIPASNYQMSYQNTQNFHYGNSMGNLALPLPVQEMHDNSRIYHSSINELCAAQDLSKNRNERLNLNESTRREMGEISKFQAKHDRQGMVRSHGKMDPNFTVL